MTAFIAAEQMDGADDASALAPIGVFDWELSAPVPRIADAGRYLAFRFLVRLHGRPIGWIYLGPNDGGEWESRLQHAARSQLGVALERAVLRRELDRSVQREAHAPPISVVVCTRDRAESLAHCLASLLTVDYPEFEIVVVDNAPACDATAQLVARLRDDDPRARDRVRYVVEQTPGLDWARNRGAAEVRHSLVAYTDDDVRVDAGWLRAIARAFTNEAVQCVSGLIVPGELETDAQVIFEDCYGGMGKGVGSHEFRPDAMSEADRLGAHHLGVGANLAFRASWLAHLGGFDTALDVGTPAHGGGDLDILHRTIAAGGVVRYEAEAIVRHYHRRSMQALRRQLRDNGRAFGVYLLSRVQRRAHARSAVARYAVGTWLRWLLGRIVRRLRGRDRLPLTLQLEELRGAAESPRAWRATYAHDRRLRA